MPPDDGHAYRLDVPDLQAIGNWKLQITADGLMSPDSWRWHEFVEDHASP